MSRKNKKKSNIGRKFSLFVKPINEDGMVIESDCGWLKIDPKVSIVFSFNEAAIFTEKEEGHGSYSDWKEYFESEQPNWKINPPRYRD